MILNRVAPEYVWAHAAARWKQSSRREHSNRLAFKAFGKKICKNLLVYHSGWSNQRRVGGSRFPVGRRSQEMMMSSRSSPFVPAGPKTFLGALMKPDWPLTWFEKYLSFSSPSSFLFWKRYSSFVPHPLTNLKKVLGSSSQSSLNCCLGS